MAANHDQKKKYLGRLTEEPLVAVSMPPSISTLSVSLLFLTYNVAVAKLLSEGLNSMWLCYMIGICSHRARMWI